MNVLRSTSVALCLLCTTGVLPAQASGWGDSGYWSDAWTPPGPSGRAGGLRLPVPGWNDPYRTSELDNDRWFDSNDFGWHPRSSAPRYDPRSDQAMRPPSLKWRAPPTHDRRTHTVRGTLASYDLVQPKSQDLSTPWLRLRFRDGAVRLIDVGSRVQPSDLDLRAGDHVVIRGFDTQVAGHWILRATHLRVGDRRIATGVSRRTAASRRTTVSGRITSLHRRNDGRALVRLRNDYGSTWSILVGQDLGAGQLSPGDRIEVRGHRRSTADRSLLVADDLQIIGTPSQ